MDDNALVPALGMASVSAVRGYRAVVVAVLRPAEPVPLHLVPTPNIVVSTVA